MRGRAIQPLLAGVLAVVAGAAAGAVWFALWSPPSGTVASGTWVAGESGLRGEFAGTGLYVVIALVTGLAVGVLSGLLLARNELATLAALVVSSVLAGWLMRQIGLMQSPPDPRVVARTAADGTSLPGELRVAAVALVALPLGALVGYALLLIMLPRREARETPPQPMDASTTGPGHDG